MKRYAAWIALGAAVCLAQITQTTPTRPKPASSTPAPSAPHKPAAAEIPSYADLKYPDLRSIASPAVETIALPNGMRLLLLENHELPLINGTILVRTGSVFDPAEKNGLAVLTGQVLLDGGSKSLPGDELTRRFENLGTEVDGSVTDNALSISFSALKENADTVLGMLKDDLAQPEFPQDRIDLAKVRMRNSIAHRNDDPVVLVRRELAIAAYGKNSPYAAQVQHASLDRINRADLVNFYQRYFFPKNVILSLEGDFDSTAMKARVAAVFEDWKTEQPAVADFPGKSGSGSNDKFLAVKKTLTQAYFAMGATGGDYQDPDNAALAIACSILGHGPHSRLGQKFGSVVQDLAVVWTPAFGHPGLFRVSGTVINPFHTPQVIRVVTEELNRMRSEEVSDQELKTAKSAALNSLIFEFDNQLSILPRLTQYIYFGLPADYIQQYQKALGSVTRADVLRVTHARLDPAQMATIVLANPTAFEAPLESLGGTPVMPLDLTIPAPKPEAALGDALTQRQGKQLLAQMQQAMGGADKLAAVNDYVAEIGYQLEASAGGIQTSMTEKWLSPGYLRQDNVTPTAKYSVYCDGKLGWVASTGGATALVDVGLKQVQGDLFHVLFPLLLSDRAANRKVNALDDRTVEISDNNGQVVKLVIDPATGLLLNMLYDAPTANGPIPVIETYSDFREAGGLKLPNKVAVTLSGKKYQDLTIKSRQINTGLKVADMERRP